MVDRFYPRQRDYIKVLNDFDKDVQAALQKGNDAANAQIGAEAARDLAQLWATKLGSAVASGEFSAKHWAQQAATSAGSISDNAALAQSWATSLSVVSGGMYGARYYANDASASATSAKNWATQSAGEVVAGQGYSAKYYATSVAASATLAQNWAVQLGTPVSGGEYSAKYHALAAAASASSISGSVGTAQSAATSAQNWATQNSGEVVAGQGYSAKYHAVAAANSASSANTSATLAQNWATQASGEVVAGQGYSAKYWALQAQSYAGQAQTGQVNADWNATTGAAQILNKPDVVLATQVNVADLDALTGNRFFGFSNAATGAPSNGGGAYDAVGMQWHQAGQRTQLIVTADTIGLQMRTDDAGNGTFGSWRNVWDSVTLTNLSQLSNGPGFVDAAGARTAITGAASTIAGTDLTVSRALVSDASGKVAVSAVTSTQLGYLSTVSSNVQTQINGKQATIAAGTTSQYWRGDKAWTDLAPDVRATALTGFVTTDSTAVVATDTLVVAAGKLQAQVSLKEPAITAGSATQYLKGDKTLGTFAADVLATTLTGYAAGTNAVLVAADTQLGAFQKLQAQVSARLSLAGGTMTGALTMGGNEIINARFRGGAVVAASATGTTFTIDVAAASKYNLTANGVVTSVAFSNWPTTGEAFVRVDFINFGNYAITPPAATWTNPDGTETTNLSTHFAALAAAGGRSGFTSSGRTKAVFWCEANGTVYGKFI